ncbi:MAG: IS1634 family transposase [Desulfobulbaceae bacterium]|nr:IS1634 family transposase [Desulfobulbaceae bacterium]
MYIRRTAIKSKKSGGQYYTYRLVESRRMEKGVRQYTLLNLGTDFSLPKEQWPALARRIEDIISGQKSFLSVPSELEALAQRYAALIIESTKQQDELCDTATDYREVDLNSVETVRSRTVGSEHLALETLRLIGLDKKLKELGFTGPQLAAAMGTIIGRACRPGSERATHGWLRDYSATGELISYDFGKISLSRMYDISDYLLKHKATLEEYLYQRERDLFDFNETVTLYDLTNTYFEGQSLGNSLGAHGKSKEKRTDCALVTLAVVLDGNGFIKQSKVFEGNISEAGTLAEMLDSLKKDHDKSMLFKKEKPTVVMDAGIAVEDNVKWLKDNGYPYLVVSRKRHREFNEEEAVIVKQLENQTVKAQKVIDKQTGEILLYCHSTQREKKEQAINGRFATRLEEALQKLNSGLSQKRCLKNYDKVIEKIGRLKQKYARAASQYIISVTKDEKSGNATLITWEHQPAPQTKNTLPGVYCIRTNQNWDEETLWRTYTMLTEVEAVFRSLKSELGLRPIFHQIADRVSSHLFITVLAYHLVQTIRYRLKKADINDCWDSIRKQVSDHARVTVTVTCKNSDTVHIRKSCRPEPRQQRIYDALGLSHYPGKTVKTTIAAK